MTARALAIVISASLLAVGCAPVAVDTPLSEVPGVAPTPQERLADALAAADHAANEGDRAALAAALADIEALGGWSDNPADEARLAAWRAQSGAPSVPMRGRTLGRGYRSGTITPGSNTIIEQTFLSGQKASIALSAAEGQVLGLSVLDGQDQPVCREQSQRASCSWVPLFTQRHTIRLRNPGPGAVRYYLVID